MHPDEIFVLLIVATSIIGFIVMCFSIAICFRIVFGGRRRRKGKAADADETKMIQEIYQGLRKMEDRIDSLETLLLSKEERLAEDQKLHDFDRKIHKG